MGNYLFGLAIGALSILSYQSLTRVRWPDILAGIAACSFMVVASLIVNAPPPKSASELVRPFADQPKDIKGDCQ